MGAVSAVLELRYSTRNGWVLAALALGAGTSLLLARALKTSPVRFVLGQGIALAVFAAGLVALLTTARARAPLERCLTLERWTWTESAQGMDAEVTADVLPGADGTLALDAAASLAGEEVWQPVVATQKLVRTPAQAGTRVQLTERLRRVRSGTADFTVLRFSCRPPGPRGVFGVIEYARGRSPPLDEGSPAPRALPAPGAK